MYLWLPVAFAVIIMSSNWASIQGENAQYTDVTKDWQACMTQAQFVTIPLNATLTPVFALVDSSIAAQKTTLGNCISNEVFKTDPMTTCNPNYPNNTAGFECFFDIYVTCLQLPPTPSISPGIPNVQLPIGNFLPSLSYIGVQAIIFSVLSQALLHRSLRDLPWLASTNAFILWSIFAIFTYYTVSPVLPVPTQTNATLLLFLIYGTSEKKYNDLNNGDNVCGLAFNYLWVYLWFLLLIVFITLGNLLLGLYVQWKIPPNPDRSKYQNLTNTTFPLVAACSLCFSYILFVIAKVSSSSNALYSISEFTVSITEAGAERLPVWYPTVWFPFATPSFDMPTVLFIFTFMSIIRGYTVQSVSAFRAACGTSIIYIAAAYPIIVGAFQFYHSEDFYNYDNCYNYFLKPSTTAFFGYPSTAEAQDYCNSFRLSLVGGLGLFASMHFVAVSCYIAFTGNSHRKSGHFEPLEPGAGGGEYVNPLQTGSFGVSVPTAPYSPPTPGKSLD